jgi:putative membrane protein
MNGTPEYHGVMHTLLRFAGTVAAILLTINLVPGITISGGWTSILLVALVWSVLTMVVRPVLAILTLPITIVTLGLFSFVLNAFLFYAMQWLVPGFAVVGFVPALLGALVLSILSWFIQKIL